MSWGLAMEHENIVDDTGRDDVSGQLWQRKSILLFDIFLAELVQIAELCCGMDVKEVQSTVKMHDEDV